VATAIPIILFILILSFVIFVHELGHFWAARRVGIFVEEFALGMGPKLFGFEKNGTLYSLRAFPIGGFCKMRGQDDEAATEGISDDPAAMHNKSIPARALVMAGGALMNFAAAFVLFLAIALLWGFPTSDVTAVTPGGAAERAGMQAGDRITHINGARTTLFDDLLFMVMTNNRETMDVRIRREGEAMQMAVTPIPPERFGIHTGIRRGALTPAEVEAPTAGLGASISNAGQSILHHVRTPFRLLARFVTRQPLPEGGGVMGPVGIGAMVTEGYAQVSQHGFLQTLHWLLLIAAVLNAAIGVMNLLPIPALDGARLVFLGIEAVRRKPVAPEREAIIHTVGIICLLALAVVLAWRDIARLL
jgi:regulator of sigma E protease